MLGNNNNLKKQYAHLIKWKIYGVLLKKIPPHPVFFVPPSNPLKEKQLFELLIFAMLIVFIALYPQIIAESQ